MNYYLLNIQAKNKNVKNILNNYILKETAFTSVLREPDNKFSFNNIILPMLEFNPEADKRIIEIWDDLVELLAVENIENMSNYIFSIANLLVKSIGSYTLDDIKLILHEKSIIVSKILEFDDNNIQVVYTDGSSDGKSGNPYGYAAAILKECEENEQHCYDTFTSKEMSYDIISGAGEHGTNNIGELTAIQKSIEVVENTESQIVVFISDSELSIKTFREYYKDWQENNWVRSFMN